MKNYKMILFILFICLSSLVNAQHKYAVLIGGDPDAVNVPAGDIWNNGQDTGPYGYDEFWNDTYLLWEMLYDKKDYTNENIYVLFNDGIDYTFHEQDDRYKSLPNYGIYEITDYSATKSNIQAVFDDLATTITQDDFLFVWIMSHGGKTIPGENSDSYIYLHGYDTINPNEGRLFDYELQDMLDDINANRKVIFVQAPHSRGFANKLFGDSTVVFTSSMFNDNASRADDSPYEENEVINGTTYNHGEFGFHIYSPIKGEDTLLPRKSQC